MKLPVAAQMWIAPSSHAVGFASERVSRMLTLECKPCRAPAAICFPSGLHAHAVTLVLPPRSLLRTTITDFDLRLPSTSQIRSVLSADAVKNSEWFFGCQATAVTAATCPLSGSRVDERSFAPRQPGLDALGIPQVSDVHVALVVFPPDCPRSKQAVDSQRETGSIRAHFSAPSRSYSLTCVEPVAARKVSPVIEN